MLVVREILGLADDDLLARRRVERLRVDSAEAAKPRLRRATDAGTDVAIDLPRGSYLRHRAVLADDGERILVVERVEEEALVVRLSAELSRVDLLRQAVALGHAFGNQHVPCEVVGDEIRMPVTTSAELAVQTARELDLADAEVSVRRVRLGCDRPLRAAGHAHR